MPFIVAAILPLGCWADAAQAALIKSEFVFDSAPFPSCHASTIAETKTGIVVAFFGGTHERHPDVCIWVCRSENGKWTTPELVADGLGFGTNRFPTWNPVLFQLPRGPLFLFYKVGPNPNEWWGLYKTSGDGGKSWSEPKRLPSGILGPIKNKPVLLPNGDLLSPSSTEDQNGWRMHFERSKDQGASWIATEPLKTQGAIAAIQPTILLHARGQLQALGRTRQGQICTTWSHDNGFTWEPLKLTDLPNPNSGIDAVTLKDRRHLLVYNHSATKARNPLNIALSRDGKVWSEALVLENDPTKRDGFAYPSVIQDGRGLVHVVYTWDRKRIKHAVIDPRRIP